MTCITDKCVIEPFRINNQKKMLASIILLVTFLRGSVAYDFGPPLSACDNMSPVHTGSPRTTVSPYSIAFSKSTYSANEKIQVTLQGTTTFKGFFVQARPSKDSFVTYGTIDGGPSGTSNPCAPLQKSAIAHTNSDAKSKITFTWTAPATNQGNVVFVYTVVQREDTYWVKLTSTPLTYQSSTVSNGTNTQAPVQSTSATPSSSSTAHASSSQSSITMSLKKDNGCGKTLGCFHDCIETDTCGFLLTWAENGDKIDLHLACQLGAGDVYCAIGLSRDNEMGDDSVFECVYSSNVVTASVSYNRGQSNIRLDDATFGISGVTTAYSNGIVSCKFSRKKTFALVGGTSVRRKREAPSAATYFDMNQDWTLFYAKGKSIAGYLLQHDTSPLISSEVADFQSTKDIAASENTGLVKAHGILMTLAWMLFSTLGIFTARFYKTAAPQDTKWFGQKPWFQTHRFCMVLTLLLTAVAFIIIFVKEMGYVDMEGESYDNFDKSHPVMGIIVMALVVINPIMALFRPHPGTSKRPLFNVAHAAVGIVAQALGIVNLFSGTRLMDTLPSAVRIVLYVFVGWTVFIEMLSLRYDSMTSSKDRASQYEMKGPGDSMASPKQTVCWFKIVVLVIHTLTLVGLCLYVVISIGIS